MTTLQRLPLTWNNKFSAPFDQINEYEADQYGFELAKKAGYDINRFADFFKKLEKNEKKSILLKLNSTHPFFKRQKKMFWKAIVLIKINMKEKGLSIQAIGITKKYPKNKIGLQSMSLDIKSKSFVALMGPSGCGKSTLLKCLNGDNPATLGEVYINGLSLIDNYDLVKKSIGYVPQDDIIHRELSVYKTLFYAAKLRLPDGTSNNEIDRRINKVLKSLKTRSTRPR